MVYELFVESPLPYQSLADMIQKQLIEVLNDNVSIHIDEEEIIIGTEFFPFALEIDDISDITFIKEHYKLNVNVCIRVQLFNQTFVQGLEYLFKVIGKLMKRVPGNLLFLENGSEQILRKENSKLIVR